MAIFSQNLCFVQSYLIKFCHKTHNIGSYSGSIACLTVKYFWQLLYVCDNILASLTLEVYFSWMHLWILFFQKNTVFSAEVLWKWSLLSPCWSIISELYCSVCISPHRKSCLRFSAENILYILFSAISAELLFPSSVFSCWKASGIHGAGSAMGEISFFLHCSQKFRGIWCLQIRCIMKDRMCFSRFFSDIWPFVPSNISRPDLRYSFSASWGCLLFPFFWKQTMDGGDISSCWSCIICETTSQARQSSEAAGFTMNGEPVSPFCPLTCTMEKEASSAEKQQNISFTGFIQSILWDWSYFDRFYFCLNSFFLIVLYGCACCMWKVLRFQFCTFPVGSSEGRKHSELRSPFFSPQAPLFPGTQFGQAPS